MEHGPAEEDAPAGTGFMPCVHFSTKPVDVPGHFISGGRDGKLMYWRLQDIS